MNKHIHYAELSNERTGEKIKLFKCQITRDVLVILDKSTMKHQIIPDVQRLTLSDISNMLPPLQIYFDDNKMFVNYLGDRWYLKFIINEDFEDDPDMISEWSKLIE